MNGGSSDDQECDQALTTTTTSLTSALAPSPRRAVAIGSKLIT